MKKMDYGNYHFSGKEWVKYLLCYVCLDGLVSYLFFQSFVSFFLLLPGCVIFFKERKKILQEQRLEQMESQFLTGMQFVNTALQAGYAVENAFKEALKELKKIYPETSFIVHEFQYIVSQLRLNKTMESLLMDLGIRSHVEDIQSFAEVFFTAKRTGGDLMAIIQNTVRCIQQKQETRREIETCLSGKQMEQNVMSVIPLFMLGYVKVTSPGFLDVLYHNQIGVLVMMLCLGIYLLAFFWGRRIMRIQV